MGKRKLKKGCEMSCVDKEFDKIAPATLKINGLVCDLKPAMENVRKFLHTQLLTERERVIGEIKQIVLEDVPHQYQGRLLSALNSKEV